MQENSAADPEGKQPAPLADEVGRSRLRRKAEALMRMALALLDGSGDLLAAARLQHAIDSLPVTKG